ncbi:iron-containing alcohol dehydrogenase [Oceanobacillus sojae]|uniref:iron-containing alcohol dehydrogenase n=1 Tax=Oceanobacillus sojae TaxID=582851 RepID=UPI0021A477B3|nr:iron-containing alcohol dehydrogenase [Oceanobacillus sojae]MCT1901963.1 iron-containing alcohol dehydrogenase [Oceanobacillus sojae]
MEFYFYSPAKIYFGQGARKKAGKAVASIGKKCLIVRTPFKDRRRENYFEEITASLRENNIQYAIFDQVKPNPTTDIVNSGVEMARKEKVDFIIGYGGGSSLDTAKAIALFTKNRALSWEECFQRLSDPFADNAEATAALPVIAITTTSGTGSQVTQAAVITDSESKGKMTIFHPDLIPDIGLIDPELILTVPKRATAITGFDALSHAMESYLNPRASVLTKSLSLQAIEMIVDALPELLNDLQNMELREKLAYADTIAGICLSNAGAEAPHPVGEMINGYYPELAHGETLAFVYPAYFDYVSGIVPEKMSELLTIFKNYVPEESERLGEKAAGTLNNFLKAIDLNVCLHTLEMPESVAEAIREKLVFNLPLTSAENLQKIFNESLQQI